MSATVAPEDLSLELEIAGKMAAADAAVAACQNQQKRRVSRQIEVILAST